MKTCEECNVALLSRDKRNRFCSRSCSATFLNRQRGGIKMKDCLGNCSNKIQNSSKSTYCSMSCRQSHKMGLWWTDELDLDSAEFPKWLRDILVLGGCEICKWNEYNPITGRSCCQIDHIDGNSRNNKRKNIRVLCPNHHSLTPTYGNLNKGRGRKTRYKKEILAV